MQSPLIRLIDDSATIRKLVEHHLTGAGYRVVFAVDAETGLELAASQLPDLIILDHQLPGVTGDHVCRVLLESEATARIPILVSSSLRSRAFVHYSDFPNVIDQLPKPFTADLLRSGVDNALQNGAMVIQAQWNGSAMPESVEPDNETLLEGNLRAIPLNSLFQFLTASRLTGRLVVESGAERIKFAIASGKIQAVYSATIDPERLIEQLPEELREFAPMIPFSLAEQRNESMSGLLKLFESTLSHATRLKALLRFQSSLLTHYALQGEPRAFSFDSYKSLPPLFQAFPLQVSLAALLIEVEVPTGDAGGSAEVGTGADGQHSDVRCRNRCPGAKPSPRGRRRSQHPEIVAVQHDGVEVGQLAAHLGNGPMPHLGDAAFASRRHHPRRRVHPHYFDAAALKLQ